MSKRSVHGTYAPALTKRGTFMFGEASKEAGGALGSPTPCKSRKSLSPKFRFLALAFPFSITTLLSLAK